MTRFFRRALRLARTAGVLGAVPLALQGGAHADPPAQVPGGGTHLVSAVTYSPEQIRQEAVKVEMALVANPETCRLMLHTRVVGDVLELVGQVPEESCRTSALVIAHQATSLALRDRVSVGTGGQPGSPILIQAVGHENGGDNASAVQENRPAQSGLAGLINRLHDRWTSSRTDNAASGGTVVTQPGRPADSSSSPYANHVPPDLYRRDAGQTGSSYGDGRPARYGVLPQRAAPQEEHSIWPRIVTPGTPPTETYAQSTAKIEPAVPPTPTLTAPPGLSPLRTTDLTLVRPTPTARKTTSSFATDDTARSTASTLTAAPMSGHTPAYSSGNLQAVETEAEAHHSPSLWERLTAFHRPAPEPRMHQAGSSVAEPGHSSEALQVPSAVKYSTRPSYAPNTTAPAVVYTPPTYTASNATPPVTAAPVNTPPVRSTPPSTPAPKMVSAQPRPLVLPEPPKVDVSTPHALALPPQNETARHVEEIPPAAPPQVQIAQPLVPRPDPTPAETQTPGWPPAHRVQAVDPVPYRPAPAGTPFKPVPMVLRPAPAVRPQPARPESPQPLAAQGTKESAEAPRVEPAKAQTVTSAKPPEVLLPPLKSMPSAHLTNVQPEMHVQPAQVRQAILDGCGSLVREVRIVEGSDHRSVIHVVGARKDEKQLLNRLLSLPEVGLSNLKLELHIVP